MSKYEYSSNSESIYGITLQPIYPCKHPLQHQQSPTICNNATCHSCTPQPTYAWSIYSQSQTIARLIRKSIAGCNLSHTSTYDHILSFSLLVTALSWSDSKVQQCGAWHVRKQLLKHPRCLDWRVSVSKWPSILVQPL
jgi:hypothetical protein